MKILMVSSEAVPYAKSGGLADVVTALSRELVIKGHDVKILIPHYGFIQDSAIETLPLNIHVKFDAVDTIFRIAKTVLHKIEFLFLQHPLFSDRQGIYGEPGAPPFSDNMYRFTLFNYAAFEICRHLNWYPDVFHCHDWPTGILPVLLKNRREKIFKKAVSVMTIHNLGYQGNFSKHDVHFTDLKADDLITAHSHISRNAKEINFLASGIQHSDQITTVSKTYASEIQSRELGAGLSDLLANRSKDLSGVLNGVDYTEWNPENDQYLPARYSAGFQNNKESLKAELQRHMKLEVNPDIPIIGMVSRLADQKGFRELCGGTPSALERILQDFPLQVIIVGTGDPAIENSLTELSDNFNNLSVTITFNNYLAHLIEAGSDFFLMPSRYEPCGLNQIYSLRYGTIPIVRKTGGLADTVEHFSDNFSTGTGIVFELMSGEAIYHAVEQADNFWDSARNMIQEIRSRCMNMRFEWDSSALSYIEIYDKALSKEGHYE
ncbi:MAG: glycogen synthase [Bacteroidetes bacterium]|nr:glycogen synthase [Bacteroidota bacterium]